MLNELKIDELLDKVDSRYGLVLAGARRARQINEYAATLGLAFEELRADKLEVGFRKPPEEADEEAGAAAAGDDYLDSMHGMGTPSGSAVAGEASDEENEGVA